MLFVDKNEKIEFKGDAFTLVVEFRVLVEALYGALRDQLGKESATRVLDETYKNGKADADADETTK